MKPAVKITSGRETAMKDDKMSRRLLIVDDIATNRIVLKVKLAAACYDTVQAAAGRRRCAAPESNGPI